MVEGPSDMQHLRGMSRYREWPLDCKVYVGGLAINTAKHEIEEAFNKYGPMKNVWVARNPPGFAFVEFEDPRDAEDAVRSMDGIRLNGTRIRCEMSHGKTRNGGGGRRGGSGGGGNRFSPARRNRHETRNRSSYRHGFYFITLACCFLCAQDLSQKSSRSPPPSGRRATYKV
ncbi:RNA-binding protein 1 [Nymphon striatum]|nr:RNA-binding protein 1 [Nymphon striatum]